MKKQLQTLTALLLVCLMLLSVTACRDKKSTSSEKEPVKSTSSEIDDVESTSGEKDDVEGTSSEINSTEGTSSEKDDVEVSSPEDTSSEEIPIIDITPIVIPEVSVPEVTDEEEPDVVIEVDANDKPWIQHPAYYTTPMVSKFGDEAQALRNSVENAKDSLPASVTGTVWYISNDGDDMNDGNSKSQAWASIFGMNYYKDKIKPGDAVLFERGGVYRGTFQAKSGVYYGAYGEGDKPCIYGSDMNYTKVSWRRKHGNIWICEAPFSSDVGSIIFNHGESVGFKKAKNYDIENNGDFWCDNQNNYTLYLYMDKNPAEAFKSIEIGIDETIISVYADSSNVTIDNLCLKYAGGHAIYVGKGSSNITVKNCEIGYIGGSYLSGTLRYGNGIEFWESCENILVENNWIYQIYDSGVTHQGGGEYVAKNISFLKNLIEYCGLGSIEYWLSGNNDVCWGENVTYADNVMRFAGYCWGGEQREDKVSTHIRSDVTCRNTMKNFKVTGNIFDQSSANLLEIGSTAETFPDMEGNIYAQSSKGLFGTYSMKAGVAFDEDMPSFINDYMGDTSAEIVYY